MSAESPPYALQNASHSAALFRQAFTSLLGGSQPGTLSSTNGGVNHSGDLAVTQNGTPNMSVNVAGGSCWIPQTQAANGGLNFGLNDATVNLAISAANATNPRIDTICATVNDAAYSGSSNNWVLQVLTGTPTSGATLSNLSGKASLAAASLLIAYVLVPANATTIVTADIADERSFALRAVGRVQLLGLGTNALSGTPPEANSLPVFFQASAAAAETTSGGSLTVTFPVAYPNGLLSVALTPWFDSLGGWTQYNMITVGTSGFTFTPYTPVGALLDSTVIAYSYIALGW